MALQLVITRLGEDQSKAGASQNARLVVGTIHDDALLLCQHLRLDAFASPYTLSFTTRSAPRGTILQHFPATTCNKLQLQHLATLAFCYCIAVTQSILGSLIGLL